MAKFCLVGCATLMLFPIAGAERNRLPHLSRLSKEPALSELEGWAPVLQAPRGSALLSERAVQ